MKSKSDGCTCWFDGYWKECCVLHDKLYDDSETTRINADIALYKCVYKKNKPMAFLMFIGVRLFGWLRYKKDNE